MIYNRWGDSLTIQVNCGKHKPKGFVSPVTLVEVRYDMDGRHAFHFVEFLKADEPSEITEKINMATKVKLSPKTLKEAIEEAL